MFFGAKVWYNTIMDEIAFFRQARTAGAGGLPGGAYLLYGDEPYSRAAAIRAVCDTLNGAAREMNLTVFTAPAAADVRNACESLPFFDERRVVIVREADADTCAALAAYVKDTPDTTVLLIEANGKPRADSPLWKALHALERTVEFARFDPIRAEKFLQKRADEGGYPLERAAARRMVEWIGCDLSALANALAAVSGYVGAGNAVTLAAVEKCVTPSSEYAVFVMLDSLVAGDREAALRQLYGMLADGADTPVRLASFFEGRFRQMLLAKQMLLNGAGEQEIVKAIGGSPYAAKKTIQNAKRCALPQLAAAVEAFATALYRQTQGEGRDDMLLLTAVYDFLTYSEREKSAPPKRRENGGNT